MITKSIKNTVACCLVGCATSAALIACSDFNDYNEVPVDQVATGNQTLWDNISQNPQLKDFAALVKRTGFDAKLKEARAYTVWAPADGTYNLSDYEQMSDSLLLAHFVKNHVAEYVHGASGPVSERIHMLNEKSFTFEGDGAYTFGRISVKQPNMPSNNGVMHLLDGVAAFHPNLFEYLNAGNGIEKLRNYFMHYNDTTLSDESVKGPMVNGVQTYLDSVLVVTNSLSRALNAKLENEDSTYTFVMPTDEAYQKMYDRVKPLYNFITTTTVQDVEQFAQATGTQTKKVTVDAAYLSDSLTRRTIVRNLIFSNNDAYNQWVVGKGVNTDTLRSTTQTKLSNPADILDKYMVNQPIELSNGYARVVDSLAFYPWETFNPQISVNPRNYLANLFGGSAHNYNITDTASVVFGKESGITNFRYTWIEPSGNYSKPDIFIFLPNVKSATYNFYVVYLPSAWTTFGSDNRSCKLNYQINYCKANGNTDNYFFSKPYADAMLSGETLPKLPTAQNQLTMETAFENDPMKTDTVFIGQFTFPVAYNGLGNDYQPNIRITSPINVFNTTQMETYTRDVRIAAIIMKPVEYDEFEANNK